MIVKETLMSRSDDFRVTRRTFAAGAGAGAAALAISGSPALGHTDAGQSGRVVREQGTANIPTPREQTLIIEQAPNNVWDSFNPFIPNGEAYNYGLAIVCREYMFYSNFLTGEVRPWLATEYTYNPDFTECTLKLNPNVTWNDGQPFTADDVVFSQTLLLENPSLNGAAQVIRDTKSVVAADPQTVVFTLTAPNPRFHYRFQAGIIADELRVVPKHIWEGQDPGSFKFNPPVQTGPYVLQEASSSKLYYLWKKNPNYWNSAELDPRPEYVLVVQATSQDTSLQEFVAGNTDVPALDFLNQEVAATQFESVARFAFPDPCPRGFYFNVESPSGLFATPEGRWAVSHLIDREVIAETIWQPPSRGASYPWADYEAWQKWAPEEVVSKYDFTFNVDKANQLLDALGATERDGDTRVLNGKPLRLTAVTPAQTTGLEYQIGANFANTAKQAGLDVEIKSLPGSAFGDAFDTGQYDMSCHWVCGMQFDPNQLYRWFHSRNYVPIGERANQGNATRLQSAELDALVEQLDTIDPDDPASKPVFDQALDVFLAELPAVPSIQTVYPFMYSTQYWTGWPSEEDPYTIPANWWGQFLFVIGSVQPASGS
jgi:peptide/nickel transport system substrate-binding protein